jgi:hypothetical protein
MTKLPMPAAQLPSLKAGEIMTGRVKAVAILQAAANMCREAGILHIAQGRKPGHLAGSDAGRSSTGLELALLPHYSAPRPGLHDQDGLDLTVQRRDQIGPEPTAARQVRAKLGPDRSHRLQHALEQSQAMHEYPLAVIGDPLRPVFLGVVAFGVASPPGIPTRWTHLWAPTVMARRNRSPVLTGFASPQ